MTRPTQPGKAWVWSSKRKVWVKPTKPSNKNFAYNWDDAKGWIKKTQEEFATGLKGGDENWAFALAAISKNAGLASVFNRAWKAEQAGSAWTKETFYNEVKKTDWYTKHDSAWRAYDLKSKDPLQAGNFASDIKTRETLLRTYATNIGATLDDSQLNDLAKKTLQSGLSTDAELKSTLTSYIDFSKISIDQSITNITGGLTGQAGSTESTIRQWATDYGVTVNADFVKQYATNVINGGDVNDARKAIVDLAKKTYQPWADNITESQSTVSAGAHYANAISNMLGVTPESINMQNGWMQKFMTAKDDKGNPLGIPEAQKAIRQSDEWATSTTGREQINTIGNQILAKMGI
jgi:hypothetical protein